MKEKIDNIQKFIQLKIESFKERGDKKGKKETEIKRNCKSKKYGVALSIIITGYLFFFLSNSIFNSEGDVMATQFNKEIAINNYKIIMKSAKYSNENSILEVNFNIEKTNLTYDKGLVVEAKERKNPSEKLTTKLVDLNQKDYTVVVNLPKEWTTVLITFIEDNDTNPLGKFYVDRREIEEKKELKEKSKREYLLQTVDEEMDIVNKKMSEIDIQIGEKNKKINQVKEEIIRLENERKYLTESELISMNSKIDQLYSENINEEKSIIELNESKKELANKIEKLNEKRADYDKITD